MVRRASSRLTLLWVHGGGNCDGCTMASLGQFGQRLSIRALKRLGVKILHHPSLSTEPFHLVYDRIMTGKQRLDLLVVEGSMTMGPWQVDPTSGKGRWTGRYATDFAMDRPWYEIVWDLAQLAQDVLAVGICATQGGPHAAMSNPSDAWGLQARKVAKEGSPVGAQTAEFGGMVDFLSGSPNWTSKSGRQVWNLPGCPPSADSVIETILGILRGTIQTVGPWNNSPYTRLCGATAESPKCVVPGVSFMQCIGCIGRGAPVVEEGGRPLVRFVVPKQEES